MRLTLLNSGCVLAFATAERLCLSQPVALANTREGALCCVLLQCQQDNCVVSSCWLPAARALTLPRLPPLCLCGELRQAS